MVTRNNSEQYLAASLDENCQQADRILGFQQIKTEEKIENIWKLLQSRDRALMQSEQELYKAFSDLEQTQAELETLRSQLQQTQAELETSRSQLQQTQVELALVNNSKFWKLRNMWFKFKRLLKQETK
jgi:peptidoglycan hydrolase CwlO-like protein